MIVVFSSHFPFSGEPFLEDELRILSLKEEILVIPLSFHKKLETITQIENVKVLFPRKKRIEIGPLVYAILQMVSQKTRREKCFAYNILNYAQGRFQVNKAILMFHYISNILTKTVNKLHIPEDAILYAYWMSSEAYFLSNYKKTHPKTTCICRTHGGDCYIDKFYQPFRREILNNMDAIFPISEAGKKSIETLLIPHVDGRCAPLTVERLGVTKLSSKMNPSEKSREFCIVTCSNVIALKRLDLMIDALAMLLDEQIHWVHFGDGELMNAIQQHTKEKLNFSSIHYEFKGRVSKSDILKWYEENHVDLFVNCSDTEGIPVSIMEAFAYGIPAIARDVGGNHELVHTGENGFLLPKESSPETIKNAIEFIMHKPQQEISQLRNGAYDTFSKEYSAEKNYSDFYNKIQMLR